jgi:hypothetical protein
MAGVNYVPGFFPTPWQNGIDLVSATGDNGFNVRFAQLGAEFQKIADAGLEPASVRSSNFDVVAGTTVTVSIASGATVDVVGPLVGVAPPAPALPLLAITSTTSGAAFSVVTCYRTNAGATQLTVFFQVRNLGTATISVTATPYVLRG